MTNCSEWARDENVPADKAMLAWLYPQDIEIIEGKQEMALLEVADVVNELKRQAFADVADYLEYGTEIVKEWHQEFNEDTNEFEDKPVIDPETGEQAFPDELFDKAQQSGLSDSQLYKQTGNSVTVNVIEYIGNLLKGRGD